MRRVSVVLLMMLLVITFPLFVHAQNDDDLNDPNATAPIDGGISLLIAVGMGYGLKKSIDQRKKHKEKE